MIVVGGGAAGMLAAGFAAAQGARVLLLEKMPRLGLKLAITGKGRCNLTNTAELDDFLARFGRNGRFLRQALQAFGPEELRTFLAELGLETTVERGGRVFPAGSEGAPGVVVCLRSWLRELGVKIRQRSPAEELPVRSGCLRGVEVEGEFFPAAAVVLATGGASYPATGSNGAGYRLAAALGHRIIPPRPALVPLVTDGLRPEHPVGLNLRNVAVRLLLDGKKRRELFGEVSFTADGLGGPTILTLSGEAVAALDAGRKVVVALDLKPALDARKLDLRLQRDFRERCREPAAAILRGLLPRELLPAALAAAGLDPHCRGSEIPAVARKKLRSWLKDLRFDIVMSRPLAEAIVTAGGLDLREVDPRSMASRKCPNLFFAGELLDLQADTGGYNLQAAFATGRLAGIAAAGLSLKA